MRVVLLGTAAGGGLPQWNCACARCAAARAGRLPCRTQDCVAVSGDDSNWWLLNASPDLRTQLLASPRLAAGPGPRDTPVRGVLLTDAEADHVLGLALLRGHAGLTVHATAPVMGALTGALPLRTMSDRYAPWEWRDAPGADGTTLAGGLRVTGHPVGPKPPRYVGAAPPDDRWVTAYRIEDAASGSALVYAPCLATWTPALDRLLSGADCALVDGTFCTADEMGSGLGTWSGHGQPSMGHLPVHGADGSLVRLAGHPGVRRVYTHLNNTNPLVDPASPARAQVSAHGIEVLPDGAEFTL
ncbi:pyrroloquinoline quinone biosynthesis protein PqqB [Streptomyces sp. NPDC056347]|uniref:pyrroloquinoline quinone biosynthesis protein PqqB n=1 Tax=Streptomyces sp. NPDC056347 TaxID=3345790 RepID=UPI0035DCD5E7